jgi:hypothetical protein
MTDRSSGADDVPVRIPRRLRDRVDAVFEDYRGYEPATFQEGLSFVCDLAENRLDTSAIADREPAATTGSDGHFAARNPSGTVVTEAEPSVETDDAVGTGAAASGTDATEYTDVIDQVFPYDWDANPTVRRRLPDVVARFVENPGDLADPADRERDAIQAVAREEGTEPALVRESLVSTLYGGAGLSDHLAGEFFSEALAEAETVAGRQPTGERTATSDGGVASESTQGSLSELVEMGTEDEPTAACEDCGTTNPVAELETVIGPEDGSTVRLLCPDCADRAR